MYKIRTIDARKLPKNQKLGFEIVKPERDESKNQRSDSCFCEEDRERDDEGREGTMFGEKCRDAVDEEEEENVTKRKKRIVKPATLFLLKLTATNTTAALKFVLVLNLTCRASWILVTRSSLLLFSPGTPPNNP